MGPLLLIALFWLVKSNQSQKTVISKPINRQVPKPLALDEAHEVIRVLESWNRGGGPPREYANSYEEVIPAIAADSTPVVPTPPAGSMQALFLAWQRGHCTGEGWCHWQHSKPTAENGALPPAEQAAVCAPLRYGVAQGLIQDKTTRGSSNIQEAVDGVAHVGQPEVALHTRCGHGVLAEEVIVELTRMVLVLAAERGLWHASRVPVGASTPAVDQVGR